MQLYEALATKVADWRKQNYPHDEYPAIGEILEWAHRPFDIRIVGFAPTVCFAWAASNECLNLAG